MPVPSSCVRYALVFMRRLLIVTSFWCLCTADVSTLFGQPPTQPSELTQEERDQLLKERDRIAEQTQALDQEGKLEQAIAMAEQMLAIERKVLGDINVDVAGSLEWIAQMQEQRDDFSIAITNREDVLRIKMQLFGEQDWRVTDARLALKKAWRLAELSDDQRARLREAEKLHTKAIQYYEGGKFSEAVELARHVLKTREEILGNRHPEYGTSLNNLAEFYRVMGDYARAEPLYKQARDVWKEALGETHPDYATSVNNLAELYRVMGDYARAEPLYKQAGDIWKRALGETHPKYAASLNNMAALYTVMADYARAEPLYEQALEIRKRVLGDTHPDYATSLNNLALLYHYMGDYARAEPLFRQALEIRKQAPGESHPDYTTSLNNLALLYQVMGDYTRAEPLFRQALEIRERVLRKTHPSYATSLHNLATLYWQMGDYARAESHYKQALEIRKLALGETHPDYATSLNDLALLYQYMGDHARAKPLYKQAQEIWKQTLQETHPTYATSLNNLALLYQDMGDYAAAEMLLREALEIRKQALGDTHPDVANSLHNVATLYWHMGDYAQAESHYKQALEIRKHARRETHLEYAVTLDGLALLYQDMGDNARADELYRQALVIVRKNLELAATLQSERQQLAMRKAMRYQLDACVSLATQNVQFKESVYREVLLSKGIVLRRQRAMHSAADDPQLRPVLSQLQSTASRLANLALGAPKPGQTEVWQRQIAELSQKKEELEQQLARASAAYRDALRPATLEDVRSALPQNSVLIDFLQYTRFRTPDKAPDKEARFESRMAAFVVRRDGAIDLVDLGPKAVLREAINTFRSDFGRTAKSADAARMLREKIWEPVAATWQGFAPPELVLISPDDVLGRLPFCALPGAKPDSYLVEELAIAVIPAAQMLVQPAENQPYQDADENENMLLVGGVDYDTRPGAVADVASHQEEFAHRVRAAIDESDAPWDFLTGSEQEVATISGLYRQSLGNSGLLTLVGTAASKSALIHQAPQCRYLHLATHGFFAAAKFQSALQRSALDDRLRSMELVGQHTLSGYHPGLLSGIVLAGANKPEEDDDGILTAEEVSTLDLSRVDLVVLTACETGLGQIAGGEGLLGLQRSFQAAGARTVIASLWKVDDQATQALMSEFYKNLWERKLPKLEALRQAQLRMLLDYNPSEGQLRGAGTARPIDAEALRQARDGLARGEDLSPFYWAAFTLSGNWR